MMKDAFESIRQLLQVSTDRPLGRAYFSDSRYASENLVSGKAVSPEGRCQYLCAVDGGNQELLGGANASLQFVRAYANVFAGKKRVHSEKHEFFALTQSLDGATFEVHLLPVKGEGLLQTEGTLTFAGSDVQDAEERSKAAQVGALSRRFAEWALCERMLDAYEDVLVLKDGTLQTAVKKEAFYAQRAWKKVGPGKALAALSKTSTLLTTTGWALSDAVLRVARAGPFAYRWVAESSHPDHPAHIAYAKLHPLCPQAFRVEAHNNSLELPWQTLCENSADPGFLGYPYVLVDADRNAKVPNEEASSLKGLLEARLKDAPNFARHTSSHAWLSKL